MLPVASFLKAREYSFPVLLVAIPDHRKSIDQDTAGEGWNDGRTTQELRNLSRVVC